MATNLNVKIDVTKINKEKLFKGEKGTYLDATIIMRDEPDQYGNCGMIVEQTTKAERDAGVKGAILGNVKWMEKKENNTTTSAPIESDSLPF